MAITKEKGDLGQSMVLADLLCRGYKVLIPLGEDWRFDLLLHRGGTVFERIQCKYDGVTEDFVQVPCRSCNNWSVKKYTPEEVEWIAVYHKSSGKCYYVPSRLLGDKGRATIQLRLVVPKNNQQKGILWAKDFEVI